MSLKTLRSGDFSEFKRLAQFETREQMDLAIRSFLYRNKHNLTDSEQAIIKVCSQLAYRLKGVIFTTYNYISEKTGFSSKTVQRAIKKFIDLSFLEKHSTIRKRGGKGHNVYVIKPCDTVDFESLKSSNVQSNVQSEMSNRQNPTNPCVSRDEDLKIQGDSMISDSKSTKREKNIVHKVEDTVDIDISLLVDHYVPKEFVTYGKLVFDKPRSINIAWNLLKRILKKAKGLDSSEKIEVALKSILSLFNKIKEKRNTSSPIINPFGYLTGICRNILKNETYFLDDVPNATESEDIFSLNNIPESLKKTWNLTENTNENSSAFSFNNFYDEDAEKLGIY
ncbi:MULTISPECIES: hypothetical protein [Bacillus]|uniref:hypothetical protein n=1 Tax=Bacillus TaxID=1386 RepID=UPI002FFBFFB2